MKIYTIAKNTLREAIRDKILYIILFFALGMMGFSTMLYYLSMQQDVKIMKDIGLGMISIFGIIVTIFVGSNMLYKEVDKKTIYTVLSKPVDRTSFIIGKFIGLSTVLFLVTFGLTIAFYLVLLIKDVPFEVIFLEAILFSYFEMLFMISVTIFFSTLTSPIITTFSTLAVFLTGRSTDAIHLFISKMEEGLGQDVMMGIFYMIPNLESVNLINQVVYGESIGLKLGAITFVYIFLYIFLLIFISTITFQRKDF
jgi:ABC-type transport system involved in multi-copper enzyme maturation permease subunit